MISTWPKQILCPVDFSAPSASALRFAARLSGQTHSPLTVLHAHSWEAPAYFTESKLSELKRQFDLAMQEAEGALEQFIARECPGCSASHLIVDSSPVDAILDSAAKAGADLIVLGTHGRGGLNRFLLGSVAERILRETKVPVLVVKPAASEAPDAPALKRILCPVNDSPAARYSLEKAAHLASSLQAELIVLHVVAAGAKGAVPDICGWLPESSRNACTLREITASGDAAERILQLSSELAADLLVIGARHRTFADTTVLGATTIRVVRHSPIPVLTIAEDPSLRLN